jgi:hypothetical protein
MILLQQWSSGFSALRRRFSCSKRNLFGAIVSLACFSCGRTPAPPFPPRRVQSPVLLPPSTFPFPVAVAAASRWSGSGQSIASHAQHSARRHALAPGLCFRYRNRNALVSHIETSSLNSNSARSERAGPSDGCLLGQWRHRHRHIHVDGHGMETQTMCKRANTRSGGRNFSKRHARF